MPFDNVARLLVLLILSVPLVHSSDGATTGGNLTGQVLINSEPAAGAVVFLHPQSGLPLPPTSLETTVRQEKLRFKPDFLVVPAGATIRFENHDDEIHNIHSKATENRFDTGAHLPGTVKEVILKNPGAVPIRCRTHQNMRALIIVAPSPYFAVADKLGQFEMRNVPAGHYRVEAWHARLTRKEQAQGALELQVGAEDTAIELRLHARAQAGADLTGLSDGEWLSVANQIQEELTKAVDLWKHGGVTPAAAKVMSVQSRLYSESGLRQAIAEGLGKKQAEEHERRLDTLRKRIQGVQETEPLTEAMLRNEVVTITAKLRRDVEQLK